MNRSITLALLLCISTGVSVAQDYQICTQVIGATGKSATQSGLSFTYTVGESVITTVSGNARILTQGFHQPELCMLVSTDDQQLADWNIEVFPNPTADVLNIRYSADKNATLDATVYNLYGQVLIAEKALIRADGTVIDCTGWQPGIYLLQLRDKSSAATATVRFIRL